MNCYLGLVPVIIELASAAAAVEPHDPVISRIILDTDMDTDCDDVGALAILHAFADEGKAEIVAVLHTAPAPWGAACIDAINTYYGRGNIPVGRMEWPEFDTDPRYRHYRAAARHILDTGAGYLEQVASSYPRTQTKDLDAVPNSVSEYRRLLAKAEDGSITVCAIGQLAGLAGLLDSKADEFSPLDGVELVKKKVRVLVTMANGDWPSGQDGFNWRCDIPSAARVLNAWPGAMAVMPHGVDVLTGGRLVREGSDDNPVRRAYQTYVKKPDHLRSSWDQCAVFYAVNGPKELFKERKGARIHFDGETGHHEWKPDAASPHIFIDQVAPSAKIAEIIEELMCRRPKR